MLEAATVHDLPASSGGGESIPFEQVLRQKEQQVIRTAYRITANWADAEDVAQEAFTRLHRHGLDFPNEAALSAWLYRVTTNLCLDRMRRRKPVAELVEKAMEGPNAEAKAINAQRKDQLMRALDTLAPKERAAIVLREIEGLTTAEVAGILASTEATVRSQISKAIGHLRQILSRTP